jgi:putative endonuclease
MKTYYVYILHCSDNTYYTGVTSNLSQRIIPHQSGHFSNSYTSKRLPIVIKYYCEFTNIEMAIDCEKQIKKWSKVKKEALITGDFDLLIELSKKKFE